jgi:hypothetical protein
MSNVMITKQGLDFIKKAHDSGVYIDLKYFVPVYDDRIDPTVRNQNQLSAISAVASIDSIQDTIGEILWKRSD